MSLRHSVAAAAAAMTTLLAACSSDLPAPTAVAAGSTMSAKGAGGGGGGTGGGVGGATCATIVVTNSGQAVRQMKQPDIRYNLENCGTVDLNVTVTFTEFAGFLSDICPAPMPAPVSVALASKVKLSLSAPTYRGACGSTGPVNGTIVWGVNRWQGHNVLLTLTDDATGAVLGTGFFSWQDVFAAGV